MVSLTEERKKALIEHCEEIKGSLSEYGYPFQSHKTKQLLAVEINDDVPIESTLFTSPPVSEIKLPDEVEISSLVSHSVINGTKQMDGMSA